MKMLCREEPYKEPQYYTWDAAIQRRYHLDEVDIAKLEHGSVLFMGDTAYCLEEIEDEKEEVS